MFRKSKSTACGCQHSAVGCLIEDKKSKSKKGHNSGKKMHFESSPLIVWIAFLIVNTYSDFQVNILSYDRYYKMSQFLHYNDADAKAMAIP